MNNMTQEGIDLIKSFEGCILTTYDDSNERIVHAGDPCYGVLTIGWGTTPYDLPNMYKGMTITQQEADDLFIKHLQRYINDVRNLGREFTDNEFSALVSFHYNTGSIRTLCANRNKQQIADAMLLYNKAGGRVLQGLVRRRQAERNMFLNGSSGTVVNINGGSSNQPDTRVKELQHLCNVIIGANIDEDNIWGSQTENAVRQLPLCGIPYTQPQLTIWVQSRLGCTPDGIFLYETANAVGQWQSQHNLVVDKIVGYNTYKSLALD